MIGKGVQTLTWPRATIRRVADSAKKGLKLFVGHNSDSSHTNRPSVGEVVGTYTRMVSGKLQALSVAVLTTVKDNLDVCSIEADVQMTPSGVVGDVNKLTGIALGSSNTDSPAFPGARRMGMIQCFGETKEQDPLEKGEKQVTFAEVQAAVKEMNIWPHQLYSIDQVKQDNVFGSTITTLEKRAADAEKKFEDIEKSSKDSIRKTAVAEAKGNFEKLIPEGVTEKQKAFLLKKFDPESLEDTTEEGVKGEIAKLQTEYSDYAKLFGEGTNPPESGKGNDNSDDSDSGEDNVKAAVAEMM